MAQLPKPKNKFVEALRWGLDRLIEGVAVEFVISGATAMVPWLAWPIVRTIFRWLVQKAAHYVDENAFALGAKFIIRNQSGARVDEFRDMMLPILAGGATDEQIQKARDAAAGVIQRGNR